MTSIKKGARIRGIRTEILLAALIINGVLEEFTITEGTGGKHGFGSLHFSGNAIDVRTRHLEESNKRKVRDIIAARLNEEFDVILEKTHIHVEFQPKD